MVIKGTTPEPNELDYVLGQNAKENSEIVDKASINDIWFHLDGDLPSPHLILQWPHTKLGKLPRQIIYFCADIVKQHSKFKHLNKVTVMYGPRRHVQTTTTPGQVLVRGKMHTIVV